METIYFGKARVSDDINAIIAFVNRDNGIIPCGFVTYSETNLELIYVVDNARRRGIATKLVKTLDSVTGSILLDTGDVSVDGARLLKSLKRPRAPFYGRPNPNQMSRSCSRIMLGCFGRQKDSFEVVDTMILSSRELA